MNQSHYSHRNALLNGRNAIIQYSAKKQPYSNAILVHSKIIPSSSKNYSICNKNWL